MQPRVNPFLDATIAFSLLDLGLGATNVIRVRRSSDDAEQDFTADQILQGAGVSGSLLNFCGAGDGFVVFWYNQVLANHASQTVKTLQPQIVATGSLITDELGNPTLLFENKYLEFDPFYVASQSYVSYAMTYSLTANGVFPAVIGGSSAKGLLYLHTNVGREPREVTVRTGGNTIDVLGLSVNLNTTNLFYLSANRINLLNRKNGVEILSISDNNSDFVMQTKIWIGQLSANTSFLKINEILGFISEPDVSAVESKIISNYGI